MARLAQLGERLVHVPRVLDLGEGVLGDLSARRPRRSSRPPARSRSRQSRRVSCAIHGRTPRVRGACRAGRRPAGRRPGRRPRRRRPEAESLRSDRDRRSANSARRARSRPARRLRGSGRPAAPRPDIARIKHESGAGVERPGGGVPRVVRGSEAPARVAGRRLSPSGSRQPGGRLRPPPRRRERRRLQRLRGRGRHSARRRPRRPRRRRTPPLRSRAAAPPPAACAARARREASPGRRAPRRTHPRRPRRAPRAGRRARSPERTTPGASAHESRERAGHVRGQPCSGRRGATGGKTGSASGVVWLI